MSTRIRYIKYENDPNMLKSMRNYRTKMGDAFVLLHTVSMQMNVVHAENGTVLASGGDTKNLAVLKIKAKKALASLGVEFSKEERVKDVTEDSVSAASDNE